MNHKIFKSSDQLLSYYQIQSEDFRMRHTAIWTEVQHYTWVLSILLGAGPIAAVGQPSLNFVQIGSLVFLPVIGIMIAVIAFLVIRRDFLYYSRADSRLLYIEKQLGVLMESDYVDERLQRAKKSGFNVIQDVKEQAQINLSIKHQIRKLILLSFALYTAIGFCETVYFASLLFS